MRDLLGNPSWSSGAWPARHAVLLALLWPAALTAVFLLLAVHRYRGQGR